MLSQLLCESATALHWIAVVQATKFLYFTSAIVGSIGWQAEIWVELSLKFSGLIKSQHVMCQVQCKTSYLVWALQA